MGFRMKRARRLRIIDAAASSRALLQNQDFSYRAQDRHLHSRVSVREPITENMYGLICHVICRIRTHEVAKGIDRELLYLGHLSYTAAGVSAAEIFA